MEFIEEIKRWRGDILEIFVLLIALVLCIYFLFGDLIESYMLKGQNLETQIREVEDVLKNLRNLETYLENTKSDLIATEQAKIKIEEEYKKVKELEKLTENQIEAISLAVNKRTTKDIIKDIVLGFVLGVITSLLGNVIYGLLKRRKTQTKL